MLPNAILFSVGDLVLVFSYFFYLKIVVVDKQSDVVWTRLFLLFKSTSYVKLTGVHYPEPSLSSKSEQLFKK